VKTTGHGGQNAQWSVPLNWTTLFKGDVRPDFVIFVWFTNPNALDECHVFIVPADVVDTALIDGTRHWHKFLRRDGTPRKQSRHTAFSWTGRDTEVNITRGFAEKWKKYEDAWNLLEHQEHKTTEMRTLLTRPAQAR
jgi:hypothetical protein